LYVAILELCIGVCQRNVAGHQLSVILYENGAVYGKLLVRVNGFVSDADVQLEFVLMVLALPIACG
jgi:hypothetical protein